MAEPWWRAVDVTLVSPIRSGALSWQVTGQREAGDRSTIDRAWYPRSGTEVTGNRPIQSNGSEGAPRSSSFQLLPTSIRSLLNFNVAGNPQSNTTTPRFCACSQWQAVELRARVSCRGEHCHLEVLWHKWLDLCAGKKGKKKKTILACGGVMQEEKAKCEWTWPIRESAPQPSRISGWGKGRARRHVVEVRTRLQMSPESLAYCLVSSLLVQPTWWPDLSASGFSHQRPLLGESN